MGCQSWSNVRRASVQGAAWWGVWEPKWDVKVSASGREVMEWELGSIHGSWSNKDKGSQVSHQQWEELQIWKVESWNEPCGIGQDPVVSMWTHGYLYTYVQIKKYRCKSVCVCACTHMSLCACVYEFSSSVHWEDPGAATLQQWAHLALRSWFLNTILKGTSALGEKNDSRAGPGK